MTHQNSSKRVLARHDHIRFRNISLRLTVALGLAIVLSSGFLTSNSATAAVIVNDDFEYASQAAFEAIWDPIGSSAPVSGQLSNEQFVSANQSVKVPGTTSNNQSRNALILTSPTPAIGIGDKLVWSFDFWDDNPTGEPQRNYAHLQLGANPGLAPVGQTLSMGLSNNQGASNSGGQYYMARILGYAHPIVDAQGGPSEHSSGTGSGAFFKLNDFGVGNRSTTAGWRNLKVEISTTGTNTIFDYYVNGMLAEREIAIANGPQQYDRILLGSGLGNENTPAYFDNMRLEFIPAIPEPASIALLGLGLAATWLHRRRLL